MSCWAALLIFTVSEEALAAGCDWGADDGTGDGLLDGWVETLVCTAACAGSSLLIELLMGKSSIYPIGNCTLKL